MSDATVETSEAGDAAQCKDVDDSTPVNKLQTTTQESDESAHQATRLDLSKITIDPDASQSFLKEGTHRVPYMLVAVDAKGNRILLKSSAMFCANGSLLPHDKIIPTLTQYTDNPLDEYVHIVKDLRAEEAAYEIAKLINIPMAETRFTTVDQVPFVAYAYIEGAVDIGFGNGVLKFSQEPSLLQHQEAALAGGALIKCLIGGWGDNGQYLKDESGNMYISDIRLIQDSDITSQKLLADIAKQSIDGMGYFITNITNLQHQINGMGTVIFQQNLRQLSQLTPEKVLPIFMSDPTCTPDKARERAAMLVNRAHTVARLFTILSSQPENTIKMLGPKTGNTSIYTEDEISEARMFLYSLINSKN